jgi:hypothetical protein
MPVLAAASSSGELVRRDDPVDPDQLPPQCAVGGHELRAPPLGERDVEEVVERVVVVPACQFPGTPDVPSLVDELYR